MLYSEPVYSGLTKPKIKKMYSHGQELFYKFVSKITNKLVKQLLSMTVGSVSHGETGSVTENIYVDK